MRFGLGIDAILDEFQLGSGWTGFGYERERSCGVEFLGVFGGRSRDGFVGSSASPSF